VSEQSNPQIRAQAIRQLELLAEQYPNQRLGQLLGNAIAGDLFSITDADLVRALNQLLITYSQFTAAGMRKIL
jgi:hypothetical protein